MPHWHLSRVSRPARGDGCFLYRFAERPGPVAVDPSREVDRLSASYLIALGARVVREVGDLVRRAQEASKRLATLAVDTEVRFRSPTEHLTRPRAPWAKADRSSNASLQVNRGRQVDTAVGRLDRLQPRERSRHLLSDPPRYRCAESSRLRVHFGKTCMAALRNPSRAAHWSPLVHCTMKMATIPVLGLTDKSVPYAPSWPNMPVRR